MKSTQLYCFSPPVMLVTLLIEFGFAAYVFWRYKLTTVTRLVITLLAFLGIFQASEYIVCTGALGIQAGTWSRLGYSAITLLPPLAIHLSMAISQKYNKPLLYSAYASSAAFIGYFALHTGSVTGATCYANYVVFNGTSSAMTWLYSLYYYGWLVTGVVVAWRRAIGKFTAPLRALVLGYASFIIPTTLFNVVDPSTISGIPSIMCGFAILFAFVLTLKVAPETLQPRDTSVKLRLKLPF